MKRKIFIGSDHAGFELKSKLIIYLLEKGYDVSDEGTFSSESVDYPDFAHKVASKINNNPDFFGVLICGSGIGVSIVANRYENVRCALCWHPQIAQLSRQHNNANVIALPGRFIDYNVAVNCLSVFLSTDFEGGRHLERIKKINNKIM